MNVPDLFDEQVRGHPEKILFHFNNEEWTFKKVSNVHNGIWYAPAAK